MLKKKAFKEGLTIKKNIKYYVYFEIGLVAVSYIVWKSLNSYQANRKYFHRTWFLRPILEGYYWIGEKVSGTDDIRAYDYKCWGIDINQAKK